MINCSDVSRLAYSEAPQIGILSCLPGDALMEVMDYLPIHDMIALHQSRNKICPIIEKTLYAKTQMTLEFTFNEIFEKNGVKIKKERLLNNFEKIKNLTNNTKEKCDALRNLIFSIFKEINMLLNDECNLDLAFRLLKTYPSEDPFLLPYVISRITDKGAASLMQCYLKPDSLFLKMIAKGLLEINKIKIDFFVLSLNEKCLKAFTAMISSNPFLNSLELNCAYSNPEHVGQIFSSARKNAALNNIKLLQRDPDGRDIRGDELFKKLNQICETHLEGCNRKDQGITTIWTWKKKICNTSQISLCRPHRSCSL